MFSSKKRYTFSERLARRERNRRRMRRIAFTAVLLFAAQFYLTGARQWVAPLQQVVSHSTVVPDTQAAVVVPEPVVLLDDAVEESSAVVDALQSSLPFPGTYAKLAGLKKEAIEVGYYELEQGARAHLTLDAALQAKADQILSENKVPWGAIVALEPETGKVLALSSHSAVDPDGVPFALRGGMPAASLFKVITTAAAVEQGGMKAESQILYRGGNYTLNKWNWNPDERRDTRKISLRKALALSCNPAFGRVALNVLSTDLLHRYADAFGFNRKMHFELPIADSSYARVQSEYELARTGAGFGDVAISPVHAAMIAASVANQGVMMRPTLVDHISDKSGRVLYRSEPQVFGRPLLPSTAQSVLNMLEETVESGTARRQFARNRKLRQIRIAAKTGTLSGTEPAGRFHWLIATAPIEKPEIALAAVVVDPGNAKINGTAVGRLLLQAYFSDETVSN